MSRSESFIELISAYIPLTEADLLLIQEYAKPVRLTRGETFLEIGMPNQKIGYLESGLVRSFYLEESGEEVTSGFMEEGQFCTDLYSYRSGGLSERTVVALTDCDFLVVERESLERFNREIPLWAQFEQNYLEQLLLKKIQFQRKVAIGTSSEAYQLFLQTYPQASRFAPRYQIASFLGISPFTLSRIRVE